MAMKAENFVRRVLDMRDALLREHPDKPVGIVMDEVVALMEKGDATGAAVKAMGALAAVANSYDLLDEGVGAGPLVIAGTPWWRCIDEKKATAQ